MPPLNRFLDDQENNVWRCQNATKRGSINRSLLLSPIKETSPESAPRRVLFRDEVETYSMIGRSDFTEEEIQNCWYTAEFFSSFKRDICTTVYLAKIDPHRIDDLEYTMRGVEHKTEEGSARRHILRAQGKSVVLDEQDFQDGIGEVDSNFIAETYSRCCSDAVFDAFNLAALDKLEAERYQQEQVYDDIFTDDWITSVSSPSSERLVPKYSDYSCLNHVDVLGFDDAWLRDISVNV